nr:MAG TPA: lytic transglycosylase [Bacteriophage sp.]
MESPKMNKRFLIVAILLAASFNVKAENKQKSASSEVKALATAIHNEARGESIAGKKAVAHVIMNRVKHKEFPNTVNGVIAQRGQFQWYRNKKLRSKTGYDKETEKIAQEVYLAHKAKHHADNTRGAIFFSSNGKRPAPRAVKPHRIGKHVFYKLKSKSK